MKAQQAIVEALRQQADNAAVIASTEKQSGDNTKKQDAMEAAARVASAAKSAADSMAQAVSNRRG